MTTKRNDTFLFHPRASLRSALVVLVFATVSFVAGCDDEDAGTGTQASAATATSQTSGALKSGNRAPQITGQLPTQVLVGHTFEYTLQASDQDGDALTFSATGLPDWVLLDAMTGTLRGKPDAADVGTYDNISIAVSDGATTSTLAGATLQVVDSAAGAATLSWMPPTGNEDGTPLSDLAGYRIRYGTDPAGLYQTLDIATPAVASYVVEDLTPGTWYFVMTAYTAGGQESKPTTAVSKSI
jgi:hypothetical protein